MKKLIILLLSLVSMSAFAQQRDFRLKFYTVTDTAELRFGIGRLATNGIDDTLGEANLPQFPADTFDVRWISSGLQNGSLRDYRYGDYETVSGMFHSLGYQIAEGQTLCMDYNIPGTIEVMMIAHEVLQLNGSGTHCFPFTSAWNIPVFANYNEQRASDVDDNGYIDISDVLLVYNSYTNFEYRIRYDLNYDGSVDITDLLRVYEDLF